MSEEDIDRKSYLADQLSRNRGRLEDLKVDDVVNFLCYNGWTRAKITGVRIMNLKDMPTHIIYVLETTNLRDREKLWTDEELLNSRGKILTTEMGI